jgi:hypothetical protein
MSLGDMCHVQMPETASSHHLMFAALESTVVSGGRWILFRMDMRIHLSTYALNRLILQNAKRVVSQNLEIIQEPSLV